MTKKAKLIGRNTKGKQANVYKFIRKDISASQFMKRNMPKKKK